MLLPGHGKEHQELMKNLRHYACIEVAIRDTYPGRIRVSSKGKVKISKPLNSKDRLRKSKGLSLVREVFESTGAEKVFQSHFGIGLHLMGGCAMGVDPNKSVVDPGFQLHGKKGVFIADSSVFPEAPGINPSLSIMALSLQASKAIIETLEKNPQ
jgi:choline dehydrogenase-like flavoprotein